MTTVLIGITALAHADEPVKLSEAQQKRVDAAIARLKSAEDRATASAWSTAKKAAEILCGPASLRAAKKQDPSVDKVFLGDNSTESLKLVSAGRLEGRGSMRTRKGWRDMTFVCTLNPMSGKTVRVAITPTR
ncbi:hypothetical protein [Paludibacterium paludis]|nr:hypothetical protein [Paludibacterium paludis]